MAFELKSQDANSVTWQDPADLSRTVRLKSTTGTKNLAGVVVDNIVTEVIINDTATMTVEGVDLLDKLSVRARVSGSPHAHATLRELISLLTATLNSWDTENVWKGFTPSTAPALPTP